MNLIKGFPVDQSYTFQRSTPDVSEPVSVGDGMSGLHSPDMRCIHRLRLGTSRGIARLSIDAQDFLGNSWGSTDQTSLPSIVSFRLETRLFSKWSNFCALYVIPSRILSHPATYVSRIWT